jgi:hypothetical protein
VGASFHADRSISALTQFVRCHRLGKECAPAALLRQRRQKKATPAVRRSQLEEKLSDLVSLLESQRSQLQANSIGQRASVSEPEAPLSPKTLETAREVYLTDCHSQCLTPITLASKSTVQGSPSNESVVYSSAASRLKAEEYLYMFRMHHLECFPLIYLPAETKVDEIQRERPFLWLNIQAVCERSPSKKNELGLRIRETLATQVVVEGERSIDLLLGLLVYMSWAFYFFRGKPLLGILTGIAKSLVIDLRLDIPTSDKAPADCLVASFNCKKPLVDHHQEAGIGNC